MKLTKQVLRKRIADLKKDAKKLTGAKLAKCKRAINYANFQLNHFDDRKEKSNGKSSKKKSAPKETDDVDFDFDVKDLFKEVLVERLGAKVDKFLEKHGI